MSKQRVDKLPLERRQRRFPKWGIGVIFLVVIAALFTLGVKRHAIQTTLASGHTVKAEFTRNYLLLKDQTQVKVAGVPVGVVSGVSHNAGGALVSMKIYGDNASKLGTNPSAALRLGSLLGGISYIQITPGTTAGSPQGVIPSSRTTVPVYVDSILSAVPPPAQEGAKRFVTQFQTTFADGGLQSTQQLLANAPGALQPSTGVLDALQGDQPGDLTSLVANLEQTDATVTAQQGQIEQVVSGLGSFSSTLGDNAAQLKELAATLPGDLANTRSGLTALNSTLTEIDNTAAVARPSIQELGKLIDQSQPTLVLANPVLGELEPFLANTSPLLQQLVPTSVQTTTLLDQLQGPVLNRTLGTILPDLNKVQNVTDEEGSNGAPATLYQAIARTASGLDGVASYYDGDGHYTPVIGGFDQNSVVPSEIPRGTAGGESTDSCGGMTCPGGSGTGDDLSGGALQGTNVTPKNVDPPGYRP